jgi:[protein-PII] uridylyltransferase
VSAATPTRVTVDNDASEEATVIEVFAHDRVGVLYAITRTMTELGLDIHLAKVATEGERVADSFYVTTGEPRQKIVDAGALAQIEARLGQALSDDAWPAMEP